MFHKLLGAGVGMVDRLRDTLTGRDLLLGSPPTHPSEREGVSWIRLGVAAGPWRTRHRPI
jgi:hypothetical protein